MHFGIARDVWSECTKAIQKCNIDEEELPAIMERLKDKLGEEEMEMVGTVARMIWMRRISMVFGGGLSTTFRHYQGCQRQLVLFRNAEKSRQINKVQAPALAKAMWQAGSDGKKNA